MESAPVPSHPGEPGGIVVGTRFPHAPAMLAKADGPELRLGAEAGSPSGLAGQAVAIVGLGYVGRLTALCPV